MISDIPTALSKRESLLLQKLGKDKKVIELGALFGYSTITLARVARHVTSIDPHEGYPEPNAPSTLKTYLNNIHKYAPTNRINTITDIYQNVDLTYDFDMGFVDLDGSYKTTRDALSLLKNTPIIIIHDFMRQNCNGVEQAIKELNRNIKVIDSCAILTL